MKYPHLFFRQKSFLMTFLIKKKYIFALQWWERMKTVLHDANLWHGDIKTIEGVFGNGVGAYFRFLRYLLLLNVAIAALV